MDETDGFLTATDRSFLRGETTYESRQGRYQRQKAIRDRTRAAFRDFTVLFEELTETERERIFEPLDDAEYHPHAVPARDGEPPELYQKGMSLSGDIAGTLMFLYLGLRPHDTLFQSLVEAAVHQTERRRFGQLVSPSLTIEETFPFETLNDGIDKLETGNVTDLDDTERQTLLEFIAAPEEYPPGEKRETAIERLNEFDQFSVAVDD